ncbi:MAG TPA: HAD hydrolase family protein, partial [Actinomycetes bacterium]|nr:HAD hydrolase family protein [Actinomycetes bacterium]
KGGALAALCRRLEVAAADVVAFGDMPNDLPMLAWAGAAYGVRTGHPEVLAAVELLIDGPEEDGVARELERLFALTSP